MGNSTEFKTDKNTSYQENHFLNNLSTNQSAEVLDQEANNLKDGRNVLPFEGYMSEQLKIAFADSNINRLTEKLGRKPSDMEVIEDYINSGEAEEWSKKNRAA